MNAEAEELVREAIASKALVVGPRDQLVFVLDTTIDHHAAEAFAAVVEEMFGPGRAIITIGALQLAVIRDAFPEPTAEITLADRAGELVDSEIVDL